MDGLDLLRASALKGTPFELVLLDYHMPHMDGLEVVQAMRRLALTPKIIALASHIDRRLTSDPSISAFSAPATTVAKSVQESMERAATIVDAFHRGELLSATNELMVHLSKLGRLNLVQASFIAVVIESKLVEFIVAERMLPSCPSTQPLPSVTFYVQHKEQLNMRSSTSPKRNQQQWVWMPEDPLAKKEIIDPPKL